MADPFVDVHQVGDALFIRELAELFVVVGLFFCGARGIVVKKQDDLFGIKDLFPAHFIKRFNGLVIQIVNARYVNVAIYDLACVDRIFSGFFRQKLFNGMHGGALLL